MLQVTSESRGRAWIFAIVVLGLLGAWVSWGLWERLHPSHDPPPVDLAQMRADFEQRARQDRALRDSFAVAANRGDWNRVVSMVDDVCKDRECAVWLRFVRAEAYARSNRWQKARDELSGLLDGAPASDADLLALVGNRAGLTDACRDSTRSLDPKTARPLAANNAAWICTLLPNVITDPVRVEALARRGIEGTPLDGNDRANNLNTLGAALCRVGKYSEAIAALTASEKIREDPFNWAFLALAEHGRGRDDVARSWATRMRRRIDADFGKVTALSNRQELIFLRREIDRILPETASAPAKVSAK